MNHLKLYVNISGDFYPEAESIDEFLIRVAEQLKIVAARVKDDPDQIVDNHLEGTLWRSEGEY